MKDIIIVGASGFGRELAYTIEEINKEKRTWNIKGFIDDNLNALDGTGSSYSILGTIKEWNPSGGEVYAIAIATPKI